MEYLVNFITPPGGIVLDPFAGSGTTCMACKKLGFRYIGIDQSEEYCEIARARIKAVKEDLRLFSNVETLSDSLYSWMNSSGQSSKECFKKFNDLFKGKLKEK